MPLFHFNVQDGSNITDSEGSELNDIAAARLAAVEMAGELLKDHARDFLHDETWSMDVTDDAGLILFSLVMHLADAPAVHWV